MKDAALKGNRSLEMIEINREPTRQRLQLCQFHSHIFILVIHFLRISHRD